MEDATNVMYPAERGGYDKDKKADGSPRPVGLLFLSVFPCQPGRGVICENDIPVHRFEIILQV
jgi:hypothetical protein